MELIITNGPGGVCPVQAEGTISGYPFYFRSRHARWSLHVASSPSGDPLDDDAWTIIEDYPLKGETEETRRVSAGYATKDECMRFIERHAATWKGTAV